MVRRVGQERHEGEELDERARPAVRQDERDAVAVPGMLVNEVDARAVHVGAEMRVAVELVLPGAPIELLGPVLERPAEEVRVGAVVPSDSGDRVGPPDGADPRAQVVEDGLLDLDAEGLGLHLAA